MKQDIIMNLRFIKPGIIMNLITWFMKPGIIVNL